MLNFYYKGETEQYPVDATIGEHIVTINGIVPAKIKGFYLTRPGMEDAWDYTKFTTIYRQADEFVQFSDDGSQYIEPTTDVKVTVAWNDEDDKEKFRPSKLVVQLFGDGELVEQFILNKSVNWEKTFKYMPVKEYSIDIPDVAKYDKNINGTYATFTHTIIPPLEPTIEEQLDELMAMICDLDERVFALEHPELEE